MSNASAISDEDIQSILQQVGLPVSVEKARTYRSLLDFTKIDLAVQYSNDAAIRSRHAKSEIRKQLAHEGILDDQVAEWVGLHYRTNFDTESKKARARWRIRWAESLELIDAESA